MKKILYFTILLVSFNTFANAPKSILMSKDFLSGKSISQLIKKDKKATVVFFMSVTCPCSMSHTPHFQELVNKHKDIQFIAINSNIDESETLLKVYLERKKVNFPVIKDFKAKLAKELAAVKTPHVYIFNNKGERIFHGGATNRSDAKSATTFYLKDALSKITNGEKLERNFARALGCYIKRDV
jgi:thiol-disulfide isomerase/thioredoxin